MARDPFLIHYRGRFAAVAGADVYRPVVFEVLSGADDNEPFLFGTTMSGQAGRALRLEEEELARILIAVGLDELEAGLRAGIYPRENGELEEKVFTSDDYRYLGSVLTRDKACLWQERRTRGWICTATPDGGDDRTTPALCSGCVIPDARLICAHLSHPSINMIDQRMGRRVPILSPLCNVGNDPEDGSECAPGGKECWERVVDVSPAPSDPPPDVAERVADELDFLALVYRGRYGSRLIEIPQARSIAELFGECEDGENFQHRVAALADLLSRLNPHDALDEEERTDDEGNRLGSLAALERLVQRDYPETIGAVRTLRAIPAARINFPIHSRSDPRLLEALRSLGVDFPATDWQLAWRQVLTAFWTAIRDLRTAIQTSAVREDEA